MVIQAALDGVVANFGHLRVALINADAARYDGTRQAIADATAATDIPVVVGGYTGRLGRGSAVRAILQAALDLKAQAVMLLDAHTTSITSNWIPALANPILERQADMILPRYRWPLPDGGLSDLIFYPLTRALWGRSLRQPGSGDCSLSPTLAKMVIEQDVWGTEVTAYGFEVWLSNLILSDEENVWRVGQVDLGEKSYRARPHRRHFRLVFRQAVGTLLRQIFLRREVWQRMPPVQSTPTFAGPPTSPAEPIHAPDTTRLVDALVVGWTEYRGLWQNILTRDNLAAVESLAAQPTGRFTFPPDLWARVVYDFAVVYNKGEPDPNQIVDSLFPLYLGRLATLWREVAGLMPIGREGTVAAQAVEFESARPYLLDRWGSYLPG
jgi:hypothetical protein